MSHWYWSTRAFPLCVSHSFLHPIMGKGTSIIGGSLFYISFSLVSFREALPICQFPCEVMHSVAHHLILYFKAFVVVPASSSYLHIVIFNRYIFSFLYDITSYFIAYQNIILFGSIVSSLSPILLMFIRAWTCTGWKVVKLMAFLGSGLLHIAFLHDESCFRVFYCLQFWCYDSWLNLVKTFRNIIHVRKSEYQIVYGTEILFCGQILLLLLNDMCQWLFPCFLFVEFEVGRLWMYVTHIIVAKTDIKPFIGNYNSVFAKIWCIALVNSVYCY